MLSADTLIHVRDSSQVGEARRFALSVAEQAGFDETLRGRAALVATELAGNLTRHSKEGGELHLNTRSVSGEICLDILSIDRGPGMFDSDRCLRDGYSTAGTPGTGLGAVRRLSSVFDIHSIPPKGTVVFSRVSRSGNGSARSPFAWAVINRPAPGEVRSGDAWSVAERDGVLAFLVADGLGHGPLAADAATIATSTFGEDPFDAVTNVLTKADDRMRGTRGAAVAVARIDTQPRKIRYAGIGNISAMLVCPELPARGLVSHNGTLGLQVRRFQEFVYECSKQSLLIMFSDGLQSRCSMDSYPGLSSRHPAVIGATLYRDFLRGRDDATIGVVRIG